MTHQELPSYDQAPAGAIRFNTDSRKLEVYTGGPVGYGTLPNGQWMQVDSFTPDIATGGTRGLISGGTTSSTDTNQIQYVNLDTTGNAIDFGDLLSDRLGGGSLASRTRGIYAGGVQNPGDGNTTDQIQFVTISSTGNATDFGNLLSAKGYINGGGSGNSTRGLFAGGADTSPTYVDQNVIQYIAIASTGDAVDFGDLSTTARVTNCGSSSTRSIIAGGVGHNAIDFVTISTLGNSADFGDLFNTSLWNTGMCSNSIRGVFGPNRANADGTLDGTMSYITIATLGNAIEFGESTSTRDSNGAMASPTRGAWAGGRGPAPADTYQDVIDYVQIMSLGDAVDFGNLLAARRWGTGCSNGHGGL